jgi:hypothetical protein
VLNSLTLLHLDRKLDRMIDMLNQILKVNQMAAVNLAAITNGVTNNTSVLASCIQLMQNLAAAVAAIPPSTDPVTQAALDALTATLVANDAAAAAAVVANTPAAPGGPAAS